MLNVQMESLSCVCTGTNPVYVFIIYIDSGIKCVLSKYSDDTTLSGAVDMPEGQDLDKLVRCVHVNFIKFNKAMCKVVHRVSGQFSVLTQTGG